MTYSTGSLIQATDFNTFAGNVNSVWANSYNQTAVTTVNAAATITATNWATLNGTVSSMAQHQGTTITSRTNPTAGNVITALANLNADINSCISNQLNCATSGTQYTSWTGNSAALSGAGTGINSWEISFYHEVQFANTTAMTNFFNCGGLVKVQMSKASTGLSADSEWNTFISGIGTIYFSSDANAKTINGSTYNGTTVVGGTGSPTIVNKGFNQTFNVPPSLVYQKYDDGGAAYSANYVTLSVGNYGGQSNLIVTATWFSAGDAFGSNISGGTDTTGISFGTAPAVVVTYIPPESTFITNTWGTPTVIGNVTVTNY